MAYNILPIQKLNDGYRNATFKISGWVNATDISGYTILDPSTLSQIDAQGTIPSTVRVKRINFDIQDGIQVDLIWDGATPTGKILLTTIGGATTTLNTSFTIILEVIKD